jgi:hypothetical protein
MSIVTLDMVIFSFAAKCLAVVTFITRVAGTCKRNLLDQVKFPRSLNWSAETSTLLADGQSGVPIAPGTNQPGSFLSGDTIKRSVILCARPTARSFAACG